MIKEENEISSVLRVGILFNVKKIKNFVTPKFVQVGKEMGFETKIIDLEKDIETQGPFDIFLQKTTGDLGDDVTKNEEKLNKIKDYFSKHPHIKVIDPIDSSDKLSDRSYLIKLFASDHEKGYGTPQTFVVRNESDFSYLKDNFSGPLVCKKLVACGPNSSHKLSIVFNKENIHLFDPPFVAQKFINHSGILNKIYVIENSVHILLKQSFQNIPKNFDFDQVFEFNSQESMEKVNKSFAQHMKTEDESSIIFKEADKFQVRTEEMMIDDKKYTISIKSSEKYFEKIDKKRILEITNIIQFDSKIELFGFDLLIDENNYYHIVDLNYFPGFKDVVEMEKRVFNLLKRKYESPK
eukprot:c17352_g1_i2.p1 GENE.c17352_g1_i2~~c17352_g1_i2.p1  ORF type:complete len:365 (-),score=110.10 c17352_g1_i2:23-1078(-)